VSQGKTKPEAIANIREAIEGWIESAKAHGQVVPEENFDLQVIAV
jgi:predicted RNase H-like HicB family nuclease